MTASSRFPDSPVQRATCICGRRIFRRSDGTTPWYDLAVAWGLDWPDESTCKVTHAEHTPNPREDH